MVENKAILCFKEKKWPADVFLLIKRFFFKYLFESNVLFSNDLELSGRRLVKLSKHPLYCVVYREVLIKPFGSKPKA